MCIETATPKDSAALVQYISCPAVYEVLRIYHQGTGPSKRFVSDGNSDFSSVLDKNPLPASVNFKVRSEYANPDSLAMITKEISQNIAVSEVQYNKALVTNLDERIRKISLILLVSRSSFRCWSSS